ncbi:MAG: translational GTPase TypA [Chloroflexi bacterium]|nr:translational GTPase TypA [Chloroflexota bacterium]
MAITTRHDIRNVAIIAHVDHGKTTLVDGLLRQANVFRANEQVGELVMDMNALEREKGITILAKNTAIVYKGVKINIIDTPGHADFSGEVERVLNMADGALLLVDAAEGPMPQTRYVLKKAFERRLKMIVVINKMDRPDARYQEVLAQTQDLFLELATDPDQLDFPVLYAVGREGRASLSPDDPGRDLTPLFEATLSFVPPPRVDLDAPAQMLVAALDYDSHKGQIAIGRVFRGRLRVNAPVAHIRRNGQVDQAALTYMFAFHGLKRLDVQEALAGDIVAVTGISDIAIGETIADAERPEALPTIEIDPPTIKMTFGVNSSPFAGREGRYCTSRQLRERLYRELRTNVSLRVEDTDSPDQFLVSGRGELHLAVLIETMRREGYEFEVSQPEVITRTENGHVLEPVEHVVIEVPEAHVGTVTEMLGPRRARMTDMKPDTRSHVRLEFVAPSRGLIGFRTGFLTAVRGEGTVAAIFAGYEPWYGDIPRRRSGVLVAAETGEAVSFGISNAQERGKLFVDPGVPIYEGMVVGEHARENDIVVNVCKEKKLTNMRMSTAEIAIKLVPPVHMSLEQCLEFVADDELIEVTPKSIRLRKKLLTLKERMRARSAANAAS